MDHVTVNEVSLRDGLQSIARTIPTDDKLTLLHALLAAGVRHLEVASFVSATAVPQMADAEALVAALPRPASVGYSVLVPNERGYERAAAAAVRAVGIVLGATDALNRANIRMTLDQAIETATRVIRRAKADGMHTRAYLAAACACPYEGPTPARTVLDLAERLMAAGADEIAIADTIGAGNPRQVRDICRRLVADHGSDRVAAHFHDTRAMALALTWSALEVGVRKFDGSLGGLGGCPFAPGASGNVATEDLVFMLEESGLDTGIDLSQLIAAVPLAERVTGRSLGGRIMPWYRGVCRDVVTARAARKTASRP